jgi:hypothetical protein
LHATLPFLIAIFALLSVMVCASAQQITPNTDAKGRTPSIGYPTVAAAFDALRAKSNVNISNQGGWTIVDDRDDQTIWSFTPANHPAHPAVIKRIIVQKGDGIFIDMSALCHAEKPACDKLVAEFQALNDKIRESFSRKSGR